MKILTIFLLLLLTVIGCDSDSVEEIQEEEVKVEEVSKEESSKEETVE